LKEQKSPPAQSEKEGFSYEAGVETNPRLVEEKLPMWGKIAGICAAPTPKRK
jgi:hypothetical protein